MATPASQGWVKVCGITSVGEAQVCVDLGASAIGVNLWPQSPRSVDVKTAQAIAQCCLGQLDVVLVVVNEQLKTLQHWYEAIGPTYIQCHGEESPELLEAIQPYGFKGLGLANGADVQAAIDMPGPFVLVDAVDPQKTQRGGTGRAVAQELAQRVARARKTVLAGGLGPENVAAAIAAVQPFGVDVASGVEHSAGIKDFNAVREFISAAQKAFQ